MSRLTNPTPQYLDSAGDPLSKGLLYFYETQTSTLADTYADSSQETKNSNPVELYADGRQPNIFFTGTLKAILTNAALEQIWEKDPVTSGTGGSLVTDWDALITYEASEIVRYNLIYYISLLNNNRDKIPGAEPLYWVTWPNGDIICDTVTATTFTGDLVGDVTGNADTATTAANAKDWVTKFSGSATSVPGSGEGHYILSLQVGATDYYTSHIYLTGVEVTDRYGSDGGSLYAYLDTSGNFVLGGTLAGTSNIKSVFKWE